MIHGIRDYGSWHPALGEVLERRFERARGYWRIVTVEYGFFSALQFLFPVQQDRLVNGFVDRYLNEINRAIRVMIELRRPLAVRVHIAAHSNGCNVLAQAITRNEQISFSRIFLAGCVLRRSFWDDYPGRAGLVRNDCATHDWPVGVLCAFLGRFRLPAFQFLGSSGVDGFRGSTVICDHGRGHKPRFVQNNRWYTGDHGAALEPARLESIAEYLVSGTPQEADVNAGRRGAMWGIKFLFFATLLLVLLGIPALGVWLWLSSGAGWGLALGLIALAVLPAAVVLAMLNI
jgi:hypothetical protein